MIGVDAVGELWQTSKTGLIRNEGNTGNIIYLLRILSMKMDEKFQKFHDI